MVFSPLAAAMAAAETVLSEIEPEGDDLKLEIAFDKVGNKRLMAKFANLEII